MATVFVIVDNQRERQVLKIICESYGYDVLLLPLSDKSLPQLIQYRPEALIIEAPEQKSKLFSFLSQVTKNAATRRVRSLVYGTIPDAAYVQDVTSYGKTAYFLRPLKTDLIRQVLRPQNGSGATLHRESEEVFEGEFETTAQIMDKATSPQKRISLMKETIGELLAFPFTVVKVLNVTQSSTTGANDLALAIEVDPVVVSTVLKVANSALYGRAGKSITSIKDAIVRIGFVETKNIAVSLSVMNLFSEEENSIGFDRKEFWYHSITVAVIAQELAQRAGFPRPEVPFVCGLLHDFGIILLDEFFPSFLFSNLRKATQSGHSFLEEQYKEWGMSHNDVVYSLFSEWNMPDELLLPLKEWRKAFDFSDPINDHMTILLHSVRAADIIAKSLALGRECDQNVLPLPESFFEMFKITDQLEDSFFKKITNSLNLFDSFLQLAHEPFNFSRNIPSDLIQGNVNFINNTGSFFEAIEYHLISQNFQLQYKTDIESVVESATPPDIQIVSCQSSYDKTVLENLATIVIEREAPDGQIEKVPLPLLVVGPETMRDQITETMPDHVGFIANNTDLRILLFSVQRLIFGHPLTSHDSDEESSDTGSTESSAEVNKPAISTRILNKSAIVISLKGHLSASYMTELKELIKRFLQKTNILIFNFEDPENCSPNLLMLLEEFRKILHQKRITLVLCHIGTDREFTDESGAILKFERDEEVVQHVMLMQKDQGVI